MICAVVDSAFGSSAKGAVCGSIAHRYGLHVRAGAANAGHSAYASGEKHVTQQIPIGAYANPDARCLVGPGAIISPDVLVHEIDVNNAWRERKGHDPLPIWVDHRAHVVRPEHIEREARSDLQERIGSTSATAKEGIGEAQATRVLRNQSGTPVSKFGDGTFHQRTCTTDVVALLRETSPFENVLLEGNQGTGLSVITGFWPFTTSRDCTSASLAADCGVGPLALDEVIMVVRSYPIRVAGNSGPFWPGSREIEWRDIGVDPDTERTTVTKKVRRVATLSYEQVDYAQWLNSATQIALTFADYLDPAIKGHTGLVTPKEVAERWPLVHKVVAKIEDRTKTPVTIIRTSDHTTLERLTERNDTPNTQLTKQPKRRRTRATSRPDS